MNVGGGEAADQMVRMMLSGTEVMVRLSGSALKNLLALTMALASNRKTLSGKVNMGKMLRETRDLRRFPMTPQQYKQFKKLAKKHKLLFSVIKNKDEKGKQMDVILPVTELDRANAIFERILYTLPPEPERRPAKSLQKGHEVFRERQAPEREAPEQVQVRRQEQQAPVRPKDKRQERPPQERREKAVVRPQEAPVRPSQPKRSENPAWEQQISQEIIRKRYNPENQIIIISTIASFKMPRFIAAIEKSTDEKLLIVDESHRFTDRPDFLKDIFQYLLGLSATPHSGSSAQKGQELMAWFGGQVFNLPIEVALERGFLVPYYYHPIFVTATEDEEGKFRYHTQKILSCFKNNKCINPDLLVKSLRNRLRVISMATEKQDRIDEIVNQIKERDHFVVYCGDGKLFDTNTGEELRHIQSIKRVLSSHGFKSSQFTAKENMADRMELVDAFNKGEISALAAIRCLDEGINIGTP